MGKCLNLVTPKPVCLYGQTDGQREAVRYKLLYFPKVYGQTYRPRSDIAQSDVRPAGDHEVTALS